jgi:hypothetical protein
MEKEIIKMSREELRRLEVIHKVIERRMKQSKAASILSLSVRQVRRLKTKVNLYGDIAIVHGGRGKPSPRKFSNEFRKEVIGIVRKQYQDFGPTFASEKLEKIDGKKVNRETLRQWMIKELIWKARRYKGNVQGHGWRKRKDFIGEMVLLDGSVHDWLEGRGPKMTLMAYIDDASNIIFGEFYPAETTESAMRSFKKYIKKYGIPLKIYFDRHSIYKTTREPNLDESLKGKRPLTQFEKVLEILNVETIHAYSPEAKGRIERLFETLQDRLIKEMRLANICSLEEANKFLKTYLPKHNARFSIAPKNPKNLHRPIPRKLDLNWVFAVRDERIISNGFTVAWKNRVFLLKSHSMVLKKKRVIVMQNLRGQIRIWFNNRTLDFQEITKDTLQQRRRQTRILLASAKRLAKKKRTSYKPPPDHPWRHKLFGRAIYK